VLLISFFPVGNFYASSSDDNFGYHPACQVTLVRHSNILLTVNRLLRQTATRSYPEPEDHKSIKLDGQRIAAFYTFIRLSIDLLDTLKFNCMSFALQFFQVLLIGNFVLGLVFIYYLLNNRERRAATSLIILFVGLLIWLLADIIQIWTPTNPAPPIGTKLRLPGADITIIGLLLFAFEYTGREDLIRKRVLALLSLKPVLSLVVVLTPTLDGLVKFTTPETVTQGYQFVPTPFFIFHITYNWVLTALAIAILVRMTLNLEYGKYRQLSVLFIAFLTPIGANVFLRLGIIQLDLTTAAFFMTATALMYATFQLRLLDKLPIARQAVLEKMDELVFVLDETGTIVTANSAASNLFKHENPLLGKHVTAVLGSGIPTLPEAKEGEVNIATRIDDELRHFTINQTSLTDYYETVVGQLLVCRDVTESKQHEREVEALNTRLELVLNETDTGIWSWNLDTDEVRWDTTSERLYGYAPGEFSGTFAGFVDRIPEEDLQRVQEQVDHAIQTGEQYRADFRIRLPEGDQRWLQARGVVKYDDNGDPERLLGIQTDVSEQKDRERQLQRQNERLEKFASVVSHDLRNPIAIAEGYLDLAEENKNKEDFQTVRNALGRMNTMIEELLTMARAEAIVEDKEPIELALLATDAWQTAQTEGATLEMDIDSQEIIHGDRELLLNLFENLFRNAVDHNEPPITVRVGTLSGNQHGFFIEDDGNGIPESKRETVFDHGHTTSKDGNGLGLYIVSELVAAHGWSIAVTAGSDGGARFEIQTMTAGE